MRLSVTSSATTHPRRPLMDFFRLVRQLKIRKRTGWMHHHVHEPESIADHMYRMGMMAFVARDASLDTNKCIKMALVHDVAESIVGDITPHCGISKEEKQRLEADAMQQIQSMLGDHTEAGDITLLTTLVEASRRDTAAMEMLALWEEYSEAKTPEAKYVKDLDKLEMILQADEYEEAQNIDLQQFFDNTRDVFKTSQGKRFADEIRAQRDARKVNGNKHETSFRSTSEERTDDDGGK